MNFKFKFKDEDWYLRRAIGTAIKEIEMTGIRKLKKSDREHYFVNWSHEDAEWVATCGSEPFLSWLDETPEKALAGLIRVLKECD